MIGNVVVDIVGGKASSEGCRTGRQHRFSCRISKEAPVVVSSEDDVGMLDAQVFDLIRLRFTDALLSLLLALSRQTACVLLAAGTNNPLTGDMG